MITKSHIQSYLQCPRKLWLEAQGEGANEPTDAQMQRRAADGDAVGAKAQEALGSDALWPVGEANKAEAFRKAMLILAANPMTPAAEVPLVFDDVYARADALIPAFAGHYVLQETKASSFPLKNDKVTPSKPETHHLHDLAIQAWVMQEAGLQMERAELNLLDGQWRYPGGGDYSGLFKQMNLTDTVIPLMDMVPEWVDGARQTIMLKELPNAQTGRQCKSPHPCSFAERCKALEPLAVAHPITLLPDLAGKTLAKKLQADGYVSLVDLPTRLLVSTDPIREALYRRMKACHTTGKPVLEPEAQAAIAALPYPRYFFDFEGIDLPIPVWAGVRPFDQLPFQFSCHIQKTPNGAFEHASFLDLSGKDPSISCIEAMKDVIKDDQGCILVYFATYERSRLKELGERHPEHAHMLQGWIDRLVDLLPIVKATFYCPSMRGSFSIKKVLKAIAPTLDYSELVGVQDGTGAQLAYIEAALDPRTPAARKQQIAGQLEVYCERDTWAMVLVAYFLARMDAPPMPARKVHAVAALPAKPVMCEADFDLFSLLQGFNPAPQAN